MAMQTLLSPLSKQSSLWILVNTAKCAHLTNAWVCKVAGHRGRGTLHLTVTAMHGGCDYFAVQVHYFYNNYGKRMTLAVTIQSVARRRMCSNAPYNTV